MKPQDPIDQRQSYIQIVLPLDAGNNLVGMIVLKKMIGWLHVSKLYWDEMIKQKLHPDQEFALGEEKKTQ